MRHDQKILLALGLSAILAAGCRKPPPPEHHAVVPTPTPVPDKDVLGFVRHGALWTLRSDGSAQQVLAQPGRGQAFWLPVSSPLSDGLVAWLSRPDGTQDIARIDLSGRVTVLTEIGEPAQPLMKSLRLGNAPSYSPDGKRIAYSFNGNLWLMDANGYNAETFIADGASWAPSFSPDGKHLAYLNGTENHFDVWMADLESRDTWQVSDFADYTVGQPRWNKDGSGLLLTRSQGEDSDVVQMSLPSDKDSSGTGSGSSSVTVTDADPLTKDHVSGAGVWDPGSLHVLYSSGRDSGGAAWNLYSADALGGNPKQLTHDGAYSPFWMRPTALAAAVMDQSPSRPTPVPRPVTAALPTPGPAATAANVPAVPPKPASPLTANAPGASTAAVPPKPPKPVAPATAGGSVAPATAATTSSAPSSPAKPAAPSAVPQRAAVPANAAPAAVASAAPQASAAPTQPPVKAAPLRLRLKASFNGTGALTLAALTELKKIAPRVAQYAGASVNIIGPLDRSPLKGKFASEESRSLARAKAVAKELVKQAQLDPGTAKAQAYAPPAAGASGAPNSIQIYVELK
jgi:hypothetical protein